MSEIVLKNSSLSGRFSSLVLPRLIFLLINSTFSVATDLKEAVLGRVGDDVDLLDMGDIVREGDELDSLEASSSRSFTFKMPEFMELLEAAPFFFSWL